METQVQYVPSLPNMAPTKSSPWHTSGEHGEVELLVLLLLAVHGGLPWLMKCLHGSMTQSAALRLLKHARCKLGVGQQEEHSRGKGMGSTVSGCLPDPLLQQDMHHAPRSLSLGLQIGNVYVLEAKVGIIYILGALGYQKGGLATLFPRTRGRLRESGRCRPRQHGITLTPR